MYVIIPARFASTRLPGKPLLDVCGKPLLQRVYECAVAGGAQRVIVATDDRRIYEAVLGFGGQAAMTSAHHASGTDRIAEVVAALNLSPDEIVVNLQGDEPLMPAELIVQTVQTLQVHPEAPMATACHPITEDATLRNPNVVKVVCDRQGYALYFSRAPIPWPRDAAAAAGEAHAWRHIGLYVYRAGFLRRYTQWPPCPLEQTEALEQLRVLWYGERIAVCQSMTEPGPGVDTPADLERVREYFRKQE